MASDVTAFPRDTPQPAVVTVTVGRNLHSPRFYGSRPYSAVIVGTASVGREIIKVFANDSDADVSANTVLRLSAVLIFYIAYIDNCNWLSSLPSSLSIKAKKS